MNPASSQSTRQQEPGSALRTLLEGLVDYAGLFPPASLDMPPAVKNYAHYINGPHAWMLGRFILPVTRIPEFEEAIAAATTHGQTWRLSMLCSDNLEAGMDAVRAFNDVHHPYVVADTLEIKAAGAEEIRRTRVGRDFGLFIEIPIEDDPSELVRSIASVGARAKVRTGGTTPGAFPSSFALARFIHACSTAHVPFKATAGLHHPMRGEYRLTYESGAITGTMYGFLNLTVAAAVASSGAPIDVIREVLEETDPMAFDFEGGVVTWRKYRITADELLRVRLESTLSIGSCSFTEPVDELKALDLL